MSINQGKIIAIEAMIQEIQQMQHSAEQVLDADPGSIGAQFLTGSIKARQDILAFLDEMKAAAIAEESLANSFFAKGPARIRYHFASSPFGIFKTEMPEKALDDIENRLMADLFKMPLDDYLRAKQIRESIPREGVQCAGKNRKGDRCKNTVRVDDELCDPRAMLKYDDYLDGHFCEWHAG